MEDLKLYIRKDERIRLWHIWLSSKYKCLVEIVVDNTNVPGLIDALAVFIKQKRVKAKGVESISNKCQKKDNSS